MLKFCLAPPVQLFLMTSAFTMAKSPGVMSDGSRNLSVGDFHKK